MNRDALGAVLLALLAVVALGVSAATLDSAVDLGGGGFGGGAGDAPSAGDDGSGFGVESPSGERPTLEGAGVCVESLREPPALLALGLAVALVAALVYRDTGSTFAGAVVAGLFGLPAATLFWLLSACRPTAGSVEIALGAGGNGTGILPEGVPGGGGLGGGEATGASAPELLFALVVAAAVAASVALLLGSGGDDDATGDASEAAAEPDPEPPDLDAVARTAGAAADRIESSDADNEVYRAWRDMTEALDVERPASSTPAEFAAAAVDAGVEEEPVVALTEVFERVRYGGEAATDDRERRAVAALRRIEERHGGDR